jgi:hypothetical protein
MCSVSMLVRDTGVSPVPATRNIEGLLFYGLFDIPDNTHVRDGHVTTEHRQSSADVYRTRDQDGKFVSCAATVIASVPAIRSYRFQLRGSDPDTGRLS